MTNNTRYFIGLLAILIFTTSCRKLLTDEFTDPEPIPVINALFKQGTPLELHASYTDNINETVFDYIDDANITLSVNGILTENLNYNGDGVYFSSINADVGSIYKCDILIPGFQTITCVDTIPSYPKIYNIKHINEAGRNEEGFTYPAIKISFANNTTRKQYYEVCIRLFMSEYEEIAELEDITDPVIINEGLPIALFSNEFIHDTVYELTLNYTTGIHGARDGITYTRLYPLIVEFRQVSHTYYRYARSLYLYENSRYPDVLNAQTIVFNTFSNIEGGYGIFAGLSVFQSDTVYPNQ